MEIAPFIKTNACDYIFISLTCYLSITIKLFDKKFVSRYFFYIVYIHACTGDLCR